MNFIKQNSPFYEQIEGSCNSCFRSFPFVLNGTFNDFENTWNDIYEENNKDIVTCGYCKSSDVNYYGSVDDKSFSFVKNGVLFNSKLFGKVIKRIENCDFKPHNEAIKHFNSFGIEDFNNHIYLTDIYKLDPNGSYYLLDSIYLFLDKHFDDYFKIKNLIQADYDFNNKFFYKEV